MMSIWGEILYKFPRERAAWASRRECGANLHKHPRAAGFFKTIKNTRGPRPRLLINARASSRGRVPPSLPSRISNEPGNERTVTSQVRIYTYIARSLVAQSHSTESMDSNRLGTVSRLALPTYPDLAYFPLLSPLGVATFLSLLFSFSSLLFLPIGLVIT